MNEGGYAQRKALMPLLSVPVQGWPTEPMRNRTRIGPQTVGDLLTAISQTSGLERLITVALTTDLIIEALDRKTHEAGAIEFSLDGLSESELGILFQVLFYDWVRRDPKCKSTEEVEYWCRLLARKPKLIDVPGLYEDIERLLKNFVRVKPEAAKGIATAIAPSHPPVDILRLFWLGDTLPSSAAPPGHRLWQLLDVNEKGEWDKLSNEEQLRRISCLCGDPDRLKKWIRTLIHLAYQASERGSEKSIRIVLMDDDTLKALKAREDKPQEKLSQEEIIELMRKKGINKNDLTDKDWRVIFGLNDAFDEGAQIGSKKGVSLHAYFGEDSATARKRLSRLKQKATRLTARKT